MLTRYWIVMPALFVALTASCSIFSPSPVVDSEWFAVFGW